MTDNEAVDAKWVETLLRKYHYDLQPIETVGVGVTLATALGENFLSNVYRVQVLTIVGAGRKRRISLIVKTQTSSSNMDKVMGVLSLFPIETKVYTNIIPLMEDLMEEFKDTRDRIWSGCLGHKPYSCLVFEDLKAEGFTNIDRTKWHSIEQAIVMLRAVARLHAMSKILLARGLLGEGDRGNNLFVTDTPTFRKYFPGALSVLSQVIKRRWGDEWKPVSAKVEQNVDLICEKMRAAFTGDKKFDVLNHGDLWSSNIMWKFTEYDNVPVSVRFIDWQFAHINSFIVDVVYFLYTSIVPSLRRENLDLLLATYQQALEKNLTFFGWDGHIPTMEDVRSEHDRTAVLCFIFAGVCLPVTSTGASGLSLDMGNLYDLPPSKIFNEAIFREEKFVREVGPDLRSFCENGVL